MTLKGAIPACIMPFRDDGSMDEDAYRRHLSCLASTEGVTAITCNGHAAEVSSLATQEKRRALDIAVETIGDRTTVIAGIYADDHQDAVALAQDARRAGVDGLLVMPPNSLAYDADPEAALRHFEQVAAAVSLPMVAFIYPHSTGMQYNPALLARICDLDSVVAVKEWSLDIQVYERNYEVVKSARDPVSLLASFSTHLLPALAVGADGILSGHGSVIASLQAGLLDAVEAGDLAEARRVYGRIQHLTRVVYRDPMPNMYARMKEQLIMLGHQLSPTVRPPLVAVTEDERSDLKRALVDAGLLTRVPA